MASDIPALAGLARVNAIRREINRLKRELDDIRASCDHSWSAAIRDGEDGWTRCCLSCGLVQEREVDRGR